MAQSSRTGDNKRPVNTEGAEGPAARLASSKLRGSRTGAIFQRIRNPSTKEGILMVVIGVLVVCSPFIPQWIRNTQEGLEARRVAQERFESSMISEELLVPIQVLPYLNRRVAQMANAETPEAWRVISFESGPCSEPHFAQMPGGKYTQSLRVACGEIQTVQADYASACADEASCAVPQEARTRLLATIAQLYDDFSDSGLVLPYSYEEQLVGP